MKSIIMNRKKGQISLADAPGVVMIVGLIFLLMATLAFIGEKYGAAIDSTSSNAAFNITQDLQTEINSNTSIAGIVLTISLVGIILSVLVGIFVASRRGGI